MAEVAAGAIVAEQVIATGLEAGAAAAVARPTLPLKATLNQVASAKDTGLKLARSHHTVTIIGNKAYIFGGKTDGGQVCTTDIHQVSLPSEDDAGDTEYACYPAAPGSDKVALPAPRFGHAAAAQHGRFLIVHGGASDDASLREEGAMIWLWDSESVTWSSISPSNSAEKTPAARQNHKIFIDEKRDRLFLHGGNLVDDGSASSEAWLFDFKVSAWMRLPAAPTSPTSSVFVNGHLYSINETGMYSLNVSADVLDPPNMEWTVTHLPSGPYPRLGSGFVPVSTGMGRHYLLQMFGTPKDADTAASHVHPSEGDVWALQLPSDTISAAHLKDLIRDVVPKTHSGTYAWGEVEVNPTEPKQAEGKAHPGPRSFFGADVHADGARIMLWGGMNPKGQSEADGWIIHLK